MEESSAAAIPRRRPWYRLHLSTFLILPLGIFVAVFVVLPGGTGHCVVENFGAIEDHEAVVHGWPVPFLWRTPRGWTGDPTRATWYQPWILTDSVREFRLFPLIADLALAGLGIALFAALVEWRRRRRRVFQFSLKELLVVALLAAIVFGFWGQQREIDREVKRHLHFLGGATGLHLVPRLPLWLRTVAGDDALSWIGINEPDSVFYIDWTSRQGISQMAHIQGIVNRFPSESILRVSENIPADDAAALATGNRLERLQFCCHVSEPGSISQLLTPLQCRPRLRELKILNGSESIDDALLAKIAGFPLLVSLSIGSDTSRLSERGLAELRNCGKLEDLELDGATLTKGALDRICDLKQLRRLNLTGAQFDDADLGALRKLDRLEELCLWRANLGDGDAHQLRYLPSLRYLGVAGTQLTKIGVQQLINPTADFAGSNLETIAVDAGTIDDELIATFKKLPRLHLIAVSCKCPEVVSKLKMALPDRVIISELIPFP